MDGGNPEDRPSIENIGPTPTRNLCKIDHRHRAAGNLVKSSTLGIHIIFLEYQRCYDLSAILV